MQLCAPTDTIGRLLASEILLTYNAQLSISADNHMIYGNEWAISYIRMLVSY